MEDDNVGSIWLECYRITETGEGNISVQEWAEQCTQIIQKLVADRKNNYKSFNRTDDEALAMALEAFGIDPATWTDD